MADNETKKVVGLMCETERRDGMSSISDHPHGPLFQGYLKIYFPLKQISDVNTECSRLALAGLRPTKRLQQEDRNGMRWHRQHAQQVQHTNAR